MDIENSYQPSFSELLAYFPGHLYWKNKAGVYLGCNQEMVLSFGLSAVQDVIGKTDFEVLDWVEANRLHEVDLKVMQSDHIYIAEESAILHGELRVFLSKKAPLKNQQGEIIGIVGTSLDITAQKQAEELLKQEKIKVEKASQAKSEFIANMSHDLRTPLSGMQALAEEIIVKTQDEAISRDAELLLHASRDLLQLIDDILEVSRAESTQDNALMRPFTLPSLVQNTISIMKPKALKRGITLVLSYDDAHLPQQLLGDHLMLQRILVNLLSNALKFTAEGGRVDLKVTLNRIEEACCYIDFIVADTGIGIPVDKLDVIFDKFTRVSASFQGQYSGSGVGLYMVKHYVNQLGGTVSVSSQLDEGSIFKCIIPFRVDSVVASVRLPEGQPIVSHGIFPRKARILLVEDNKIAQHSELSKFNSFGCEVVLAESGKEALAYFEDLPFDFLLVDVGLPDIDGWDLIRQFRAARSNPNHLLPLIVLTAHLSPEDLPKIELVGATEALQKPLMLKDIGRLLHQYIAHE